MPTPIIMPALSPTMTKGHLMIWHKNVHDVVNTGDLLLEIETDKAVMEVEATQSGIVDHLVVPGGTHDVEVGTIIAVLRDKTEAAGIAQSWLLEKGLNPTTLSPAAPVPSAPSTSLPAADVPSVAVESASESVYRAPPAALPVSEKGKNPSATEKRVSGEKIMPFASQNPPHAPTDHRIIASPLARKWAEHHDISLHHVQGTGPRGRIVKEDVIAAMNHGPVGDPRRDRIHPASETVAVSTDEACLLPVRALSEDHRGIEGPDMVRVPLSGMRKVIAQRLTLSKQTVPHFYLSVECRMGALVSLRSAMNGEEKNLSINDFMVRACALALRKVPEMRLMWGDEHEAIQHQRIDLAVAVSIPGGLITPIVQWADTKPLRTLALELKSLIAKAREGKLSPSQYQGGLFTLSNLGMMGIDGVHPIINPVVGAEGSVIVEKTMIATIAADHRVIDGAIAAQFLTTFQQLIEHPMMLVS